MFLILFVFTLLANGILSVDNFTCESNSLNIRCGGFTYIVIENANYGRHNSTICPKAGLDQNINCTSTNATQILQERCNDKNNCTLPVINQIFGDPCVGTYKYLEVNYICQGRPIGPLPFPIIPLCGPNEEVTRRCGFPCESRRCNSPEIIFPIGRPWPVRGGIGPECFSSCCVCRPGYLKDSETGICVKAQYCPLPGTHCKNHEVFSECGASCQRTCLNQEPSCKNATCDAGYVCADKYVRDCASKRCVEPSDCPKRVTPI